MMAMRECLRLRSKCVYEIPVWRIEKIGIYYNQESFDLTAINQIATELDDENRNNLVVPPGAWGD